MKQKFILGGIFLVILILVLIWIQGGFHEKVPGGQTVPERDDTGTLKTWEIVTSVSKGEVTATGTVTAKDTARIASRLQGFVVEVKVDPGDKVARDQVLLSIDDRELKEQVAQAEAQVQTAQANLSEAKRDFDRYEKLLEQESIARQQFERVRTGRDVAEAALGQARARLEEARTLLSYSIVRSPFKGTVGERKVNVGDLVTPGQYLLNVFRPGTVELVARVGEQYAGKVAEEHRSGSRCLPSDSNRLRPFEKWCLYGTRRPVPSPLKPRSKTNRAWSRACMAHSPSPPGLRK